MAHAGKREFSLVVAPALACNVRSASYPAAPRPQVAKARQGSAGLRIGAMPFLAVILPVTLLFLRGMLFFWWNRWNRWDSQYWQGFQVFHHLSGRWNKVEQNPENAHRPPDLFHLFHHAKIRWNRKSLAVAGVPPVPPVPPLFCVPVNFR